MSEQHPPAKRFALAIPLLHAALMSALLLPFTWPAATAEPRNVPIGLAGPAQLTETIAEKIDSQRPGAFTIEFFDTTREAAVAIRSKEIFGAIEVGAQTRTFVASASNSGMAQAINELGSTINESVMASQGVHFPTLDKVDIAPLPEEDPRGQVLGSASLPLVIAGISLGALAAMRGGPRWTQISIVTVGSLVTGYSLAYILNHGLAVLPGGLWLTSLAVSGMIGAIGFTLLGAHRLAGIVGLGLFASTFFLLGNPLSGISIPAEFYPDGWGTLGQLMPLGAGFELIKRVNFFELAETSSQWWVLGTWILLGVTMWSLSFFRREPNMNSHGISGLTS